MVGNKIYHVHIDSVESISFTYITLFYDTLLVRNHIESARVQDESKKRHNITAFRDMSIEFN